MQAHRRAGAQVRRRRCAEASMAATGRGDRGKLELAEHAKGGLPRDGLSPLYLSSAGINPN